MIATSEKSQTNIRELYRNSKYPVLFKFSHPYKKLLDDELTTIRSLKYAKEHDIEIGSMGWIMLVVNEIPIPIGFVQIVSWSDKKICDMSIELLKKDVEYGQFTVNSHEEFVTGLNELTLLSGIPYANNRLTTIKRIFYLKKLACPEAIV